MSKLSFTPPHNDTVETHSKKSRLDFKSNSKPNFMYNLKSKLKAKLRLSLLSLFSLVFIACGGGGGGSSGSVASSTKSDTSIHDSAVQGLDYILKSKNIITQEGVTKAGGIFAYASSDESVTFKLATLDLGTFDFHKMKADKKILVGEVLGLERTNTTNKELIKILRVLQTLDDNSDEDIIHINNDIKDSIKEYMPNTTSIKDLDIEKLRELVKKVSTKDLISELLAVNHYQKTINDLDTSSTIKLVSAKLVGASSMSTSKATAEWIDAIGDKLTYDVHISTTDNFIPSRANFKLNTSKNFSHIDGLTKDTRYYIAIVSKSASSKVTSNYLSFSTASYDPVLKANINIHESTSVLTNDSATIESNIKEDDFIFSTKNNAQYLKKVSTVTAGANGSSSATVKKATLRDVYDDISFSTTIKMQEVTSKQAISSKTSSKISALSVKSRNNIQNHQYKWGSGLSMSSSNFANTSKPAKHTNNTQSSQAVKVNQSEDEEESDTASYFKSSIGSGYATSVGESINLAIKIENLGERKNYEFDGTSEDSDAKIAINKKLCEANNGTFWDDGNFAFNDDSECRNMPVTLCKIEASLKIKSFPKGASKSNLPYIKVDNNIPYIKWSPISSNVDSKQGDPYIGNILIDTTAGIFCGRSNQSQRNGKEKLFRGIEPKINLNGIEFLATNPLPNGAIALNDSEKNVIFDKNGFKISNTFVADFTPEIEFNFIVKRGSLQKGEANIKSTLKLRDVLEVSIEKEGKYTFNPKPIYTKQFTKVFPAGPVPVVVIGRLRLMAVAEVEASGKLEASLDLSSTLDMNVDIHYNTSTKKWEVNTGKDLTYDIKAGGKGDALATVTIRIIPSFELSVYDLVAAHTVLEPYIYSTLGIQGEINAQLKGNLNDSQVITDASIQFTKLEAGAGMDFKVYVGAAFDVSDSFVTLAWPEDAVFASSKLPSINTSFMNSAIVKEYYEATKTYNTYHIIPKTRIVGIPDISVNFDASATPPESINSRAIKLIPKCDEVINPLFKIGLGKKSYITCAKWSSENITSNFDLIKEDKYYWMVPKANDNGNYQKIKFRLVNNSSLGWARQYKTIEYEDINISQGLPTYWINRYDLSLSNGDFDDDGISDNDEFKNGTNPRVKNISKPNIASVLPAKNLTVGALIAPISFTNTGGAIISCLSSQALPTGLSISDTCVISGTPTTEQSAKTYSITASNEKGSSTASISLEITAQAITAVPTNLSAVSGNGQVSLSWNAVSGATYNLYYGTNTITDISLASLSKVPNISTNTKTITNLTNDTKYYFVITAVKDSIESVKSNEVNASPSLKVVKDICKVDKSEHGLASMLFDLDETTASYDNPGYVKGSYLFAPYAHLITGMQAHAGIDFRTKDGANAGRHKVYSLSSGEVVKAENGTNYGAVGIKTTNKENENIVIFYSHLDSTTLSVGDEVEIGTLIGLSGKKGTKAPHLHLEYRVNYTSNFMLGAKSCTNDDCSIAEIKTLTNDPIELLSLTCTQAITAVPTNLSAVSSDGQVSLSWNAVSGATYNLYYGTNTITDISSSSLTKISTISTNTKTITNLTNDTKYYFVITAVKDNIESLKSTQVNSIPKAVVVSPSNSKLNDTGITWGGVYPKGNNRTCTSNISAPQDCHTGRDKSGSTGFDFTRLDSNGSTHSGSAYSTSPWSCVRDNVTGLVWEVKTNDGTIHDKDKTYKWGGISAIGKNHASKEGTYYNDWNSLVNGAKNASLCGFNDWRVPKKEELRSIVHYGRHNPSIDTAYFPNTVSSSFWSSSPNSYNSNVSWYVFFGYGYDSYNYRNDGRAVRLVRGGE